MNWDNVNEQSSCPKPPVGTDACGTGATLLCSDPAYAAEHPDICGSQPKLILKPSVATVPITGTLTFTAYVSINGVESVLSSGVTFASSSVVVATIDETTGEATGVTPGVTTISAQWKGLTAYAQLQVVQNCQGSTAAMMLVLDCSKSMSQAFDGNYATKLEFAKAAASAFIQNIDTSKDAVGLVHFSDTATLDYTPTSDVTAVAGAIAATAQTANKTNLGGAIQAAVNALSNVSFARKIIVLFTDGYDHPANPYPDGKDPSSILGAFRSVEGQMVFMVAIRSAADAYAFLASLGTPGFFLSAYAATAGDTINDLTGLKGYICSGYCPDNPQPVDPCNPGGYGGYDFGCLPEPPAAQTPDPNPLPDNEYDGPPVYTSTQCATASCPTGTTGDPVTRCATATSTLSQADADRQALFQAQQQSQAALVCSFNPGVLDGLMWKMPCTDSNAPTCHCADPKRVSAIFSGGGSTLYNIRVRIRGIIEFNDYKGSGTTTNVINVWDGGTAPDNGFNVYNLEVYDDKGVLQHTYRMNQNPHGTGTWPIEPVDYQFIFQAKPNWSVVLSATAQDGSEIGNYRFSADLDGIAFNQCVVEGVPIAAVQQPFPGQFLRMDVVHAWEDGTVEPSYDFTLTNDMSMVIPDQAIGTPWKLPISGKTGTITSVTVSIANFYHEAAYDVVMVLVAPDGTAIDLMSFVGELDNTAITKANNITLVFDDTAVASLPTSGSNITSGTYKPTQGTPPVINGFPAIASVAPVGPVPPYASTLSALNGKDPNGVWTLIIADNSKPDRGYVCGGWTLNIQTA